MLLLALILPAHACAAGAMGFHDLLGFDVEGGAWLAEGVIRQDMFGRVDDVRINLVRVGEDGLPIESRALAPSSVPHGSRVESAEGVGYGLPERAAVVSAAAASLGDRLIAPVPKEAEVELRRAQNRCLPLQIEVRAGEQRVVAPAPVNAWTGRNAEVSVWGSPDGRWTAAVLELSTTTSFHYDRSGFTVLVPGAGWTQVQDAPVETCEGLEGTWGPPVRVPVGWMRVTGVETDDVLNVRVGPSARTPRVGALAPDARCVPVRAVDQRGWLWVEGLGWAHGSYLEPDLGCPISASPPAPP
ncbi:MAG: SH3 domain-containing protein [Alphaproteobacteria bacterium]|nr:SH3 domain-containing protein [Alphaproteobacteria bacterium]